jgi:uncharacterized protein (DUF305 family)
MQHMDGGTARCGRRAFDRAFADEMVGHHRGAIAMAEAVLSQTRDAELRELVNTIIHGAAEGDP